MRSDAWVKFDSGVIFLNCFILYRQTDNVEGPFFVLAKVDKGRLSNYRERFWNKSFICSSLLRYYIKQIYFMLSFACSVIDHRRSQNGVRTSVTQSAIASCATCTCVLQLCTCLCRPLQNNNVKWPSSAYFGERERRQLIFCRFIWNWTLVLHTLLKQVLRLIGAPNRSRRSRNESLFIRRCSRGRRRHWLALSSLSVEATFGGICCYSNHCQPC